MYIEFLILIDFWINLIILYGTAIILKRKIKFFMALLSSFVGTLSILILFLDINSVQNFILKTYFSILMILFAFGYNNFFKNLIVFYLLNFSLGGVFYVLKIKNIFLLFILFPIVTYFYIRFMISKKRKKFFDVTIYIDNFPFVLKGFLDTGNTLMFKKNLVIICNLDNNFNKKKIYVPYSTVSGANLLECIKIDKVVLGEKVFDNVLLGFSDFKIKDANVLLNSKMEE